MQNDFLEGKPNYLSLEGTNEVETTKIDNLQKFFFSPKLFARKTFQRQGRGTMNLPKSLKMFHFSFSSNVFGQQQEKIV